METLTYQETRPLNIPADVFNADGIAVLSLDGCSYGGAWVLDAQPVYEAGLSRQVVGTIETGYAPRQPERALTALRAWLEAYCEGAPFALVHFESLNDHYGPYAAPFFCSAQAAIAIPMA